MSPTYMSYDFPFRTTSEPIVTLIVELAAYPVLSITATAIPLFRGPSPPTLASLRDPVALMVAPSMVTVPARASIPVSPLKVPPSMSSLSVDGKYTAAEDSEVKVPFLTVIETPLSSPFPLSAEASEVIVALFTVTVPSVQATTPYPSDPMDTPPSRTRVQSARTSIAALPPVTELDMSPAP